MITETGARVCLSWKARKWLQKQRIPLARCNSHFVTSDLRKFAEQHGDVGGGTNPIVPIFLRTVCEVSNGVIIGTPSLSTCMMRI